VRGDDICCAYPEREATKDLVRGNNGSKADSNSSGDTAAATDLRHATMPATHLIFPLQKGKLALTTIPPPKTDTEIEHLSTINQETRVITPKTHHNSNRGIQTDIYLQTPTGECVPGHEVQWELNPYAMVCGDNSGLMGIVPGHHHFWASTTAITLCTLAKTDLRSQFYKTPLTRESSPTSQPVWSLGKGKIVNSQKRFASRHQVLEARENARNVATSPGMVTTSLSTPSQNQGRPDTDDDIHREARAQEPINEETAVPLQDNNLFYKNGNPKPPSTERLLIRGLTSKARKRPGGRKKDRRRNRRRGSPAKVLKELNFEIAERTNEVNDHIQTDGDASSEPPTQHMAMLPRERPVHLFTYLWAACFEPNTALLLQDPLNHDTYDPGKTLSRSIGSLKHRDSVLAEKHGPD